MELCLAAKQNSGLLLSRQWWEHPKLYIPGIRAGNEAAEGGGETGTEKLDGEEKRD